MTRFLCLFLIGILTQSAWASPKTLGREAPRCEQMLDDAERLAYAESQLLRAFARLKSGKSLALGVDELRYFETVHELGGISQAKVLRAMTEARHDKSNTKVLTPEESRIFREVADRLEGRVFAEEMAKGFAKVKPEHIAAENEWNTLDVPSRMRWEALIYAWNQNGQLHTKDIVLITDSSVSVALRRAIYWRLQNPLARAEMLKLEPSLVPHPDLETHLQLTAYTREEDRESRKIVADLLLKALERKHHAMAERVRVFTEAVQYTLLKRRNPSQHVADLLRGLNEQGDLSLALFVIQLLDHKGVRIDEAVIQSKIITTALPQARALVQQEPSPESFSDLGPLHSALFVIAKFGGQQSDLLLVREAEQRWIHMTDKVERSEMRKEALNLIFPPMIRWLSQRASFPHEMEAKIVKPTAPRPKDGELGTFSFVITIPQDKYISTTYPAEAVAELILQGAMQQLVNSYFAYEKEVFNDQRDLRELKVYDAQTLLILPIMTGQSPWPKHVVQAERQRFKDLLQTIKDPVLILADWTNEVGFGQSAYLFDRHTQKAWVLSLPLRP